MPKIVELPEKVRPFRFHGVEISHEEGHPQGIGNCPFCLRDGKFYVNVEDGRWDCKVCGEKGNVYTFLRTLYHHATYNRTRGEELTQDRRLLRADTLETWGLRTNHLTGEWMVPGYSHDGKLNQIYRYFWDLRERRWKLLVTPTLGHCVFGVPLYDKEKPGVYFCEGIWDAMALWEVLRHAKRGSVPDVYEVTSLRSVTLSREWNVLATPSCNVFGEPWGHLLEDKDSTLLYDNDHPIATQGRTQPPPGFEGVKRVAGVLSRGSEKPRSLSYLRWGDGDGTFEGFDPGLKHGFDLRDALTGTVSVRERVAALSSLLQKVTPVPGEWSTAGKGGKGKPQKGSAELKPLPCTDWKTLVNAFRKPLKWTEGLDRALSVMLAVVASTEGTGDQVWARVMGPPACGKTTLAEAVSVARKYVVAKSIIRGLHSGSTRGLDENSEHDNSLINHLYNKTLIIKDADTIMNGAGRDHLMAELRDAYDRVARSSYRNGLGGDHTGLNMTLIICGTGSLRGMDAAEKGCRFIDCVLMKEIETTFEREVLWRKAYQVVKNRSLISNGKPETQNDPDLTHAMQLTGGYVDYLRTNASELMEGVSVTEEQMRQCISFALFVAYLRARPSDDQLEVQEREFGGRLMSQFLRLGICLAVVLNRDTLDTEVMRRVRQCALDTADGRTQRIVGKLYQAGREEGLEAKTVAISSGEGDNETRNLLRFLRQIGATETFEWKAHRPSLGTRYRWRLTQTMEDVYAEAVHGIVPETSDAEERTS